MERFSVHLVTLDPATGAETAKTRPCVVVSPNELNRAVATVIIAPMTRVQRGWPTRVPVEFQASVVKSRSTSFVRWTSHDL